MGKLHIRYDGVVSAVLFTGLYAAGGYLLIGLIDHFVYQLIAGLMAGIIYLNILRFFIFEICTLTDSRTSEFFTYFILYCITAGVLALPFFLEPQFVFESPTVRLIIICFATLLLTKYATFMILGPWHDILVRIRHRLYFDEVIYEPKVSVMIPAWNEGIGLISTIESVLASTYRNFEIVVINDGSTDDSNEKMLTYVAAHADSQHAEIPINYQYQNNTGKGGALNHAIRLATGDILISIDADCLVDSEAIASFVETFKDPKVSAAVGNVKIANRDNVVGIVQYLEFLFSFYFKRADALLGTIYIIGGAAGAFRKDVFDTVGGYSETNITEDIELTVRIQDAGMKIEYTPEAVVYTEGASDLASLKRQRLRWKRGRFQTFYQHWRMFFSTKRRHNKVLTWVMMPLAMLQELQLLLEIPFLIFLYVFSIMNADFSSYLTGVLVVSLMFVVQFMFYDKSTRRLSFVLLAPIGWLLFYMATYVEAWALVRSIESFITKREVTWQKWKRKGISHVKV